MWLQILREKSDEGAAPGDKQDVISSTNAYVLEKNRFPYKSVLFTGKISGPNDNIWFLMTHPALYVRNSVKVP
jgi:hypothetical protein